MVVMVKDWLERKESQKRNRADQQCERFSFDRSLFRRPLLDRHHLQTCSFCVSPPISFGSGLPGPSDVRIVFEDWIGTIRDSAHDHKKTATDRLWLKRPTTHNLRQPPTTTTTTTTTMVRFL